MLDFDVQRCTRKCFASGRELRPGETYYSVLVQEGGDVIRRDYAADAWTAPPDNAVGWWKSQMPGAGASKLRWAPGDVMLDYFEQLADRADQADVRYVLALLMIRRRVVRQEAIDTDKRGQETLILYCPKNEQEYRVVVALPGADRVAAIQDELTRLLYGPAV